MEKSSTKSLQEYGALILRKLEGTSFSINGIQASFVYSGNEEPAFTSGGEGYAIPISYSGASFILKTFRSDSEERKKRGAFLINLRLHEYAPFSGAPLHAFAATLPIPGELQDVEFSGYICKLVAGDRFDRLRLNQKALPLANRIRLAAQLCLAVEVLEKNGIAHGDLSPQNLFIENAYGSEPALQLIDFDGFYHPDVPPVPLPKETDDASKGGRSFGSENYSHAAYATWDESTLLTSDRFAMAALVFEMIVFDPGVDSDLLCQSDIDQHRAVVSAPLAACWPAGWMLLQQAVESDRPESAPAPKVWRNALLELWKAHPGLATEPGSEGPERAAIVLQIVMDGKNMQTRGLVVQQSSFAPFVSSLDWLHYRRSGNELHLHGTAAHPFTLYRHSNRETFTGTFGFPVYSGDVLRIGGVEIAIMWRQDGVSQS